MDVKPAALAGRLLREGAHGIEHVRSNRSRRHQRGTATDLKTCKIHRTLLSVTFSGRAPPSISHEISPGAPAISAWSLAVTEFAFRSHHSLAATTDGATTIRRPSSRN